jgi:molybdopterin/thiamine biosynthesis adenylyltransferase/nitroreductase
MVSANESSGRPELPERESFRFETAFDRNIGWLTEWEQQALRGKRVAIAGMGGVGGSHLLTLARLGIGAFRIADLDRFELANFNRQAGANMQTIGRTKTEVLCEMALAINPELRITRFDSGVREENIDAFLDGVDLFVDGFDFFVLDIRRKVFARCAELGIPAVTAAPVGMGVGFLAFTREGMAFEDYFQFEGRSELRQYVHFLLGVAPRGLHRSYLVDPSRLDFGKRKAPSTVIGCELCAAYTAAQAVKLLLGRGVVKPAPYHHHFDAYLGKSVITHLRSGNAGRLQTLKGNIAERVFRDMLARAPAREPPRAPSSELEDIIDTARWAPSGDNAQPWRFRPLGEDRVLITIANESGHNVYEYRDAEPTLISAGILLETLRIAASRFGRRAEWRYLGRDERDNYRIEVHFPASPGTAPDPLLAYVPVRSVNRWPYRRRRLEPHHKQALAAALGPDTAVTWHENAGARWQIARLNGRATDIRLRIPETFPIHQRIIDWGRKFSPTGIPAGAVGLDAMTLRIMKWAMRNWSNTQRLNRIAGTSAAVLQMDYLPGLSCAAYFSIAMRPASTTPEARVEALLKTGTAVQRFWLTATKLGLAVQPCLATLAFSHYGRTSAPFTSDAAARRKAAKLAAAADKILGAENDVVFMGRIGSPVPRGVLPRSTRRPFDQLIEAAADHP